VVGLVLWDGQDNGCEQLAAARECQPNSNGVKSSSIVLFLMPSTLTSQCRDTGSGLPPPLRPGSAMQGKKRWEGERARKKAARQFPCTQ